MYEIILRFDQNRTKDKTHLRAWYLTLGLKYSLSNYDKWSPEIERLSPNKIRYMHVDMFRKSQCTFSVSNLDLWKATWNVSQANRALVFVFCQKHYNCSITGEEHSAHAFPGSLFWIRCPLPPVIKACFISRIKTDKNTTQQESCDEK